MLCSGLVTLRVKQHCFRVRGHHDNISLVKFVKEVISEDLIINGVIHEVRGAQLIHEIIIEITGDYFSNEINVSGFTI